jgi:transposase
MKPNQNYTPSPIKWQIVQAKEAGETDRQVATRFGKHYSTVSRIYTKFLKEGGVERSPKTGRRKKCNEIQERLLVQQVKWDQKKTATDVTDQARRVYGVSMTQRTARNILIRYKLFARRPASVPLLQDKHRKLRKKFVLAHRNWKA